MSKKLLVCASLVLAILGSVFLTACGNTFASNEYFEEQYEKHMLYSAEEIRDFTEKYSFIEEDLRQITSYTANYKVADWEKTKTNKATKAVMLVNLDEQGGLIAAKVQSEKVYRDKYKSFDKAFGKDGENYSNVNYTIYGNNIYITDYYKKTTNKSELAGQREATVKIYSGTNAMLSGNEAVDQYGYSYYDVPYSKPIYLGFPNLENSDAFIVERYAGRFAVIESREVTKLFFPLPTSYSYYFGVSSESISSTYSGSIVVVLENKKITAVQYKLEVKQSERALQIFPSNDVVEKPNDNDFYDFETRILREKE